jgi:protein-L-isoaspartate(D-aspartate) O-methyltransferase
VLPEAFLRQVKVGGRILAVIGEPPVMQARLIERTSETGHHSRTLFETNIKPLREAAKHSQFRF